MAGLQKIETPKRARALDTSGNNNHGQIYSGRALEFDGVSDYLSGPATAKAPYLSIAKNFTVAFWVKVDTFQSSTVFAIRADTDDSVGLIIGEAQEISFVSWNGTAYSYASFGARGVAALNGNTWYRVVCTMSPTSIKKLYINGVLQTGTAGVNDGTGDSIQGSELGVASTSLRIGVMSSGLAYPLEGKLSDFQAWDATWTQSDVTYDYLNPEQLALNNGGTSLTESNLKVWYPMQDGHRGQQSYILDGANAGLGDDIAGDGGFDIDVANNTIGTYWKTTASTWTISDGVASHVSAEDSSDTVQLRRTENVVVGTAYKIQFDIVSNTGGGSISIDTDGGSTPSRSAVGTYTEYITATTVNLDFTPTSDFVGAIDNVKIYPINAKNHATTVFYGDELLTNTDFASNASGWTAGTDMTISSESGLLRVANDGSGSPDMFCSQSFTTVIGRTYRAQITLENDTTIAGQVYINNSVATGSALAEDTSITHDGSSTDNVDLTFVATATTTHFILKNSADQGGRYTEWDNASVKEVGIATGWTDADQQLDIPQTALQSYNQLAWFDGDNDNIDLGSDKPNDGTGAITISAWIYPNTFGENSEGFIIDNTSMFLYVNDTNDKLTFSRDNSTELHSANDSIAKGIWQHIVVISDSDGDNTNFYINGSLSGTANQDATTPVAGSNNTFIGNNNAGTRTFNGSITEVAIWDSVLTLTEIQSIFNDGKALDVSSDSGNYASSDDLVGYWRNNGLATWQDETANNNDGTVNNITETILLPAGVDSSRDTQGFIMNRQRATSSLNLPSADVGAGAYVAIDEKTYDVDGTAHSFDFWYSPAIGSDNNIIMGNASDADYNHIRIDAGIQLFVEGITNNHYARNNTQFTALTPGEWYHFAIVFNGDNSLVIYKGGETLGAVQYGTGDPGEFARDIKLSQIGKSAEGAHDAVGQIDDLRIYEGKALSAPEVKRNYNAGKRSHR